MSARRVLIVGEQPAESGAGSGHFAMYPMPPISAGRRLCELTGLEPEAYLSAFSRTNLMLSYQQHWRVAAARERAREILLDEPLRGRTLLLVGRRVRDAFAAVVDERAEDARLQDSCRLYVGLRFTPDAERSLTFDAAWVPHTSGRNRWWNDEANRARGQKFLRLLARKACASSS